MKVYEYTEHDRVRDRSEILLNLSFKIKVLFVDIF